MRRSPRILTLLLGCLPSLAVGAAVIRVPHDQPTIQAGINAASAGDTVLVADGTYTGPGNRDIDYLGKAITLLSEHGPAACVIDCLGSEAEPHRGFWFHSGEGPGSVLQGFTIQGGYLSFYDPEGNGAGICCQSSSPTIRGNAILGNRCWHQGAGIYCEEASPEITGNTLSENNSAYWGGGICCGSGSHPKITENILTFNNATIGGGIAALGDAHPYVVGNQVTGNYASEGGGLGLFSPAQIVCGNFIADNHANSYGGGIIGFGAIEGITANIISGNDAGTLGGGLMAWGGVLANNLVTGNSAHYGGGIVGGETIRNCTLTGNSADFGGGVAVLGTYAQSITDTILWDNSAPQGRELYLRSEYPAGSGHLAFGNPPGERSVVSISHSDVAGGESEVYVGPDCSLGWDQETVIDTDPLFAEGPGGDFYLAQTAAGQPSDSPCLDAGSAPAAAVCFPVADGPSCMDRLTTRTDQVADAGQLDLGYHPAIRTVAAGLSCQPTTGTLPFIIRICCALENRVSSPRDLAGRMDLELASGATLAGWREGIVTLGPGESLQACWQQLLPSSWTLLGVNTLTLQVQDVTASPWNEPPYPPAGDSATDVCVATGSTPPAD